MDIQEYKQAFVDRVMGMDSDVIEDVMFELLSDVYVSSLERIEKDYDLNVVKIEEQFI